MVDEKTDNIQEVFMELIVNAGDARSCAFEAIESAKPHKFNQAGVLVSLYQGLAQVKEQLAVFTRDK